MQVRSKKYAENAYPLVSGIKNQQDVPESKYRTPALSLPTMIMQSGLAQSVGFLMANSEKEHAMLLKHLAGLLGFSDVQKLHAEVLAADIVKYQILTHNAIEASSWLKRYTQALLEK